MIGLGLKLGLFVFVFVCGICDLVSVRGIGIEKMDAGRFVLSQWVFVVSVLLASTGLPMTRASCLSGFTSVGSSCYQLSAGELTWDGAKTACETLGTHLVTFTSATEESDVVTSDIFNGTEITKWVGREEVSSGE